MADKARGTDPLTALSSGILGILLVGVLALVFLPENRFGPIATLGAIGGLGGFGWTR